MIQIIVSFIKNKLKARKKRTEWRMLNQHNFTTLGKASGVEDFKNISVGKHTYGEINFQFFGGGDEKITIGNYCSIAGQVMFLAGGGHDYRCVTTYPYKAMLFGEEPEAISKGSITVGDDVWIGYDSLILSGVTIGQGAVVGAKSLVTRDIPPYAIVGGNPAKIIKYRFSETVIEKLLKIDFNNFEPNETILQDLYVHITDENVDELIQKMIENSK